MLVCSMIHSESLEMSAGHLTAELKRQYLKHTQASIRRKSCKMNPKTLKDQMFFIFTGVRKKSFSF